MFGCIIIFAVACYFLAQPLRQNKLALQAVRVLDGALREPWVDAPNVSRGKRPYLSPFTKKSIAASQKWRCASCGRLLDESYEIDLEVPLCRGGDNNVDNLPALHRKCHMAKTAMDARL